MELEFVRGDTFPFKAPLKFKDGTNVKDSDIKTLFVTCRRAPEKGSPIIFQKNLSNVTIEDGYCHVIFNPEDTEDLDYGKYYFDIEVTLNNGTKKTRTVKFELTKETTIHGSGDVDGI